MTKGETSRDLHVYLYDERIKEVPIDNSFKENTIIFKWVRPKQSTLYHVEIPFQNYRKSQNSISGFLTDKMTLVSINSSIESYLNKNPRFVTSEMIIRNICIIHASITETSKYF
jgi:hypothetical protein